jgi:glycosyltransferase involved in cell wall biosynthesis
MAEVMRLDVIYPVHERLEYVLMTLPLVVADCEQSIHNVRLWIIADNCSAETHEILRELTAEAHGFEVMIYHTSHGNSYDCTNIVLDEGEGDFLVKWDNDILIQPGSTDVLVDLIARNNRIGFLSPTVHSIGHFWPSFNNDGLVGMADHTHIGGIGVFRRSVMQERGRIKGSVIKGEERYHGFTIYQQRCKAKKMVTDAVYVVELDKSTIYSRLEAYTASMAGRNIIGKVDSVTNRPYFSVINKTEGNE